MSESSTGVRERLDESCRECGKEKDDADEIVPFAKGRWSLGPEWICGSCLDSYPNGRNVRSLHTDNDRPEADQ